VIDLLDERINVDLSREKRERLMKYRGEYDRGPKWIDEQMKLMIELMREMQREIA
jgi:hypothetical protein